MGHRVPPFFVHQPKAPNPEESWYLLSGTAIGNTGGRLHLEVVSSSISKYRKVWDRESYMWGKVEVEPDSVVVSYEKQGDPRTAKSNGEKLGPGMIILDDSADPAPKRFSEVLRVTSNGLEPGVMKRVLIILIFASFVRANAQTPGPADCTQARDQYTRMNDHLLLDRQADSDRSPKVSLKRTGDLTGFITRIILARLTDIGDPSSIRAYLTCMQEREGERPWDGTTNTPQMFLTTSGPVPLAVSSMVIMRGGVAIPNTLALVQCFARIRGTWTLVPNLGDEQEFDSHTLFINELRSPEPDESWYLLSGRAIGDTGGRLRLEVVACGAKEMRTVWKRDEILHGEIEVTDQSIVSLTYEKQEDERTAEMNGDKLGPEMIIMDGSADPDPKRFSEILRVTRDGLELIK